MGGTSTKPRKLRVKWGGGGGKTEGKEVPGELTTELLTRNDEEGQKKNSSGGDTLATKQRIKTMNKVA